MSMTDAELRYWRKTSSDLRERAERAEAKVTATQAALHSKEDEVQALTKRVAELEADARDLENRIEGYCRQLGLPHDQPWKPLGWVQVLGRHYERLRDLNRKLVDALESIRCVDCNYAEVLFRDSWFYDLDRDGETQYCPNCAIRRAALECARASVGPK